MSENARPWNDYPPATDDTVCETCGERGHYWCCPSRVLFKGRGVPLFYPSDFEEEEDDERRAPDHAPKEP